jgi:hypothetical protein
MTLPLNFIQARYTSSFGEYKDNPFVTKQADAHNI